jgi:hypothetical protein
MYGEAGMLCGCLDCGPRHPDRNSAISCLLWVQAIPRPSCRHHLGTTRGLRTPAGYMSSAGSRVGLEVTNEMKQEPEAASVSWRTL